MEIHGTKIYDARTNCKVVKEALHESALFSKMKCRVFCVFAQVQSKWIAQDRNQFTRAERTKEGAVRETLKEFKVKRKHLNVRNVELDMLRMKVSNRSATIFWQTWNIKSSLHVFGVKCTLPNKTCQYTVL